MTTSDTRREKLLLSTIKRNDDWPKARRLHLRLNPKCAVCGVTRSVTAHHIEPYYLFPERELDPKNLITLCESGANHHLCFGHLMSYKSYNPNVVKDSILWRLKILKRPKWKEVV